MILHFEQEDDWFVLETFLSCFFIAGLLFLFKFYLLAGLYVTCAWGMLFGEEDDFEPEVTTHGSWIEDEEEAYWSDHWYFDINPEETGYTVNEVGDLFFENDLLTYDLTDLIESKAYFNINISEQEKANDKSSLKTAFKYLKNLRNFSKTKIKLKTLYKLKKLDKKENEDLKDVVNLKYFLNLRKNLEDALREVMIKDPRRTFKGKEGRESYRNNIDLLRSRWINTGLFPYEDHDYFDACYKIQQQKRINHYSYLKDSNYFFILASGNKKTVKKLKINNSFNNHINSAWYQYVKYKYLYYNNENNLKNDIVIIFILSFIIYQFDK